MDSDVRRWFIDLAYRGEPFHGWQRQPGDISVQQVVEEALATVVRRPVAVTGAGRTDAGVNARRMVAHCDLPADVEPDSRLILSLNSLVGHDIVLRSFTEVAPDAHARFDATSRTYRYFAHTAKNPFVRDLSWQASPSLDFEAMNRAAALVLGQQDFTSFSKLHTDVKTNICRVDRAEWVQCEPDRWYFEIRADRFLRNMVRAVVGTLVEVGRGKIPPEEVAAIIARRDRCAAGTSMPAKALFLWGVTYDYYSAEG